MIDPVLVPAGFTYEATAVFVTCDRCGQYLEHHGNSTELHLKFRHPHTVDKSFLRPVPEDQVSGLIYYMLLGNSCKIGFTTGLRNRVRSIRPEQVLAVEYGSYEIEASRHLAFGHLRRAGEWFRYEDALVDWVKTLQSRGLDFRRTAYA